MLFWLSVPFTISFFIWVFFFKNIVQIKTQSISYLEMFMDKSNILSNFIIVVIGAFGFYSVYFVIAPKVLQKAKATQIALLTFALFIGTFLFLYSLSFFFPEIDWLSSYVAYPILLFFSAIGALFRVWEYGRIKERENAALERKNIGNAVKPAQNTDQPTFFIQHH